MERTKSLPNIFLFFLFRYCRYFRFIATSNILKKTNNLSSNIFTLFFSVLAQCNWVMHTNCPHVICYVISSIVKVLRATSKIIVLQRAVSFLRSRTRQTVIYLNHLECSVTFPVCLWDWDCHQNTGKQTWILHVADLCQDRFGWVMLRYFSIDFHVGWFLSWVPQHYKLCSYQKGKEAHGKQITTEMGQTLFIIS